MPPTGERHGAALWLQLHFGRGLSLNSTGQPRKADVPVGQAFRLTKTRAERAFHLVQWALPRMLLVERPCLAKDLARYDLYEIRQILLPPSSDKSSDPSGSWSKPTGRPQTSCLSGASMNPVMNSFGPPCGFPPLNGMNATE